MKKSLTFWIKTIGLGVVIIIVIGFGIPITHVAPKHAQVYVDDLSKQYYAPPCLSALTEDATTTKELLSEYRLITRADAFELKYSPNEDYVNAGAFTQDESLTMILFRVIRIYPEQSRWNADGTWNW